jgi:hypothetical protein
MKGPRQLVWDETNGAIDGQGRITMHAQVGSAPADAAKGATEFSSMEIGSAEAHRTYESNVRKRSHLPMPGFAAEAGKQYDAAARLRLWVPLSCRRPVAAID